VLTGVGVITGREVVLGGPRPCVSRRLHRPGRRGEDPARDGGSRTSAPTLVTICTAGGARTQEGLLGLIQAPKIAAAAARLQPGRGCRSSACWLHPATGAAWAALANQADIILAEPGARIGPGGATRLG
jgi:hypothetical protein